MTTSDLPLGLTNQVESDFDPVGIFRQLVQIPCVSFNEYLMYRCLTAEFSNLRNALGPTVRDRLRVTYTDSGQLLVSWRGSPHDSRRTVLVAHVDREGFLVRSIDGDRALCWHTAASTPEPYTKGRRVRLLCRDRVLTGRVGAIVEFDGPVSAEMPFDHTVEIEIDHVETAGRPIIENAHFIGIGHYEIPTWDERDGVIAANHVDNTAGVSVLTAVMRNIVRGNWKVNVDCLFTTCEEAGFCGIVAEILAGTNLATSDGEPVMCIVVDSSDHTSFQKVPMSWELPPGAKAESRRVEAMLQDPVVRTGDSVSIYDLEVSKLLWAAASNLDGGSEQADWIPTRRSPSVSGALRRSLDLGPVTRPFESADKGKAAIGRLVGGWCEATPLMLANAIRERRHPGAPALNLRVGALAIPISGYRNSFKEELQPEKCHPRALRATCQILGEAVRLCHRWPFGLRPGPGADVGPDCDTPKRVDKLLEWQDVFEPMSQVTRNWTRDDQRGL